jgi:hypothetical protein
MPVDQLERAQIRIILEHLGAEFSIRSADKLKVLYQRYEEEGLSHSDSTIAAAISLIEGEAFEYIEQAVDRVAAVAKDTEAFALITSSFTAIFRLWHAHIRQSVNIATKGMTSPHPTFVGQRTDLQFADIQKRSMRGLEIYRFTFTQTSPGDSVVLFGKARTVPVPAAPAAARPNVGGKPLAAHWDDMWSSIAVQLYVGDLQPQTQADIENAIKDWFSRNNLDIGDTAVRQRARQLWGKLDSAK